VLADVHGNLPALEAVLRDVEDTGVDAIVLNGDLADGPMPAQTIGCLEQLGERAIWVRGNTDRSLAEAFDGSFQPSGLATNPPPEYFAWCASRIAKAHRDSPLASSRRARATPKRWRHSPRQSSSRPRIRHSRTMSPSEQTSTGGELTDRLHTGLGRLLHLVLRCLSHRQLLQ
jgi:hypothetical protein